jgi:TonB family protein
MLFAMKWQVLSIVFVCLCAAANAQVSNTVDKSTIEKDLKGRYQGKVVRLRHFHKGNFLRYTKTGSLIHTSDEGTWTIYSLFEIKDVAVREGRVQFKGRRRAVLFNPATNRLEQHRTGMDYRAEIEYGEQGADPAEIERALQKIFLAPSELLADFVPDYWKKFLEVKPRQIASPGETGEPPNELRPAALRVRDGITAPALVSRVEPYVTDEARKAGLNGTVILNVVISKDGTPQDIELRQPLGLGLDEEAIAALHQWKFKPAKKNGEPVEVGAQIEITFH